MLRAENKPPATGTKDPLPFPHLVIGRSLESKEALESYQNAFRRNSGFKDLQVHNDKIHCLAWSKDGKYLATGSYDKTVVLWSFKDLKLTREYSLKGHSHSVDQVAWHPSNPDQLLSLSADKTVRIWSIKQRVTIHTFAIRAEVINVTWAPDGESFVIGDKDDTLTFIHIKQNARMEKKFPYEVNEMTFRLINGTTYLFFAGGSPTGHGGCLEYFEYNFPKLTHINSMAVSGQKCIAVEMDANEKFLAIGGDDSNITLWNLDGLFPMNEITRHKSVVRSMSFSHDSRFLASTTGEDGCIDVALVETGEKVWSYSNDEREKDNLTLVGISFHPKRSILACAYDLKDRHKEYKDTSMIRLFGVSTVPEEKKKERAKSRERERLVGERERLVGERERPAGERERLIGEREREREKDSPIVRNGKEDGKAKDAAKAPEKPKFETKFSFLKPTAEQLTALEERKTLQAARDAKAAATAKLRQQTAAASKVSTRIIAKPGQPAVDQPSRSRIRAPIQAPEEPSVIKASSTARKPEDHNSTTGRTSIQDHNSTTGRTSNQTSTGTTKKEESRPKSEDHNSNTGRTSNQTSTGTTKKEESRPKPSSDSDRRKSDQEDSGPDKKKRRSTVREEGKGRSSSSAKGESSKK